MEPRPAFLHPPRNDEPKACWDSESKPSGQHRKGNISPGTRTRLGEKHGIEVEAKEQEKRSNSRESPGSVKTTTAIPAADPLPTSTAMSRIPTKQVGIARTTAMTKIASTQPTKATASGLEVLSLSSQPQPSGPKLRSPNASHEKKLQVKAFNKNIQKTTSASHIMGSADSPQKTLYKTASASQISSTDSPKSLNRTSLSHIPRATSSPKLKLSHPASLKVDKTERNRRVTTKEGSPLTSPKDKMIDTLAEGKLQLGAKAAGESPPGCQEQEIKRGIERVGDEREDTVLQDRDLTVICSIGCKQTSSLSSKPATDPTTQQLKEPEDKTDSYVGTQEKHAENSQRQKEKEERRQTGERKDESEIKKDKMATDVKQDTVMHEKNTILASKKLSCLTTEGFPVPETKDVALQADLHPVYVDVEVQAVTEVCSRSTDMSPVRDSHPRQLNPEIDLNPKVDLHNDLNPERNSNWLPTEAFPDLRATGAKPRFLGPPPYKSPNSQKPLQHVCQIEIELCSPSPQTLSSVLPKVTISEFDATCQLSPGEPNKTSNDSLKLLNSGRTGEADRKKEESGAPQQIIWDEQGMTWEVYGASLDMESLGFAIQNHLQCKIREHERRIGTLRKSICLSEQSPEKGRTAKRKSNVFRSLFSGSNCCSKPQPKEELPK